MLNRTIAPPIKDAVDFTLKLKPYEHYTLDNGVPVYVIDAGAQDVIQVEVVLYAGNWTEQRQGIAAATNYMLKNGTTSRSAFQLNEDFEYYGAYCNRACYNETAVLSLHTLTKHLPRLLPVMNDMLSNATFPEAELEIYKQNAKQRLSVSLQKAEFIAGRMIDVYLYGEHHPYGTYTSMDNIDALNADDLRAFYKENYINGSCAIFVAGKLAADLQTLLKENFGSLTLSKPTFKVSEIKATPAVEKKYRIENDANAVQGAIRIASEFPGRHHEDFKKIMLLNTLFGGFFGSRLMGNIREDKGYTYGIHSYIQNHTQQSAWMISTDAGKDVCEATIKEVYKEMKKLRDKKIGDEELLLVRNFMMGSILGDLNGPFQLIAKWKNIILNNLDENYFYESLDAIRYTSADELMALANKYLQPEKFYELVVY
jgi:zinc protease